VRTENCFADNFPTLPHNHFQKFFFNHPGAACPLKAASRGKKLA
jgi:hypothetical protein